MTHMARSFQTWHTFYAMEIYSSTPFFLLSRQEEGKAIGDRGEISTKVTYYLSNSILRVCTTGAP
jgi:hypothetical protein